MKDWLKINYRVRVHGNMSVCAAYGLIHCVFVYMRYDDNKKNKLDLKVALYAL